MDRKQNASPYKVLAKQLYKPNSSPDTFLTPIGEARIQIANGLVESIHKIKLYGKDINPDNTINWDGVGKRTAENIPFDLHNEVSNCLQRLAHTGWISKDYICTINKDLNPQYSTILTVKGWYCGPRFKDYLKQIYPETDVDHSDFSSIVEAANFSDILIEKMCEAIIHETGPYSEEWYCAKICGIYFYDGLDSRNPDGVNIYNVAHLGMLIEQLHWKMNHEKDAIANKTRTDLATKGNKQNADLRKEAIIKLAFEYSEKNELFLMIPANKQAPILLSQAFDQYPNLFGSKKTPKVKVSTVSKYLEDEKWRFNSKLQKVSDEI